MSIGKSIRESSTGLALSLRDLCIYSKSLFPEEIEYIYLGTVGDSDKLGIRYSCSSGMVKGIQVDIATLIKLMRGKEVSGKGIKNMIRTKGIRLSKRSYIELASIISGIIREMVLFEISIGEIIVRYTLGQLGLLNIEHLGTKGYGLWFCED